MMGTSRMTNRKDLEHAAIDGAAQRIRPMLMTGFALFMGLVPIMYSTGTGADVMKRIAAPMLGGILSSLLLVLLVFPGIYTIWKGRLLESGNKVASN